MPVIVNSFLNFLCIQLHVFELGIFTSSQKVMIVLEYVSHGDLNSFLVNQRPM